MAIKKKKISEFPLTDNLEGFCTIGYKETGNETVRADLGFVEKAAERAEDSAEKAALSIAETKAVTSRANAAATKAENSAAVADQATGRIDAAVGKANQAWALVKDGLEAITPVVGDNGNWIVAGQDTGKSSYGLKGEKGDTGPKGDIGEPLTFENITPEQLKQLREPILEALSTDIQQSFEYLAYFIDKKQDQLTAGTGIAIDNNIISVTTDVTGFAGRRWNESLAKPVGEAYGNIDMLRELPSLLGLGCYLVTDDRKRRKLDPTNHYKFTDGTTAALDGSMGQYMWCWNAHYYAHWTENGYFHEAVSLAPFPDRESYYIPAGGTSALGNGVIDRDNNMLCSVINNSPRYRGGANQAAWDGTYRSQLGKPGTSVPVSAFSNYARRRGKGWEANWYVSRAVQEYLFRIIMGTRNSQSAFNPEKDANGLYQGGLGAGVTNLSTAEWNSYNQFYPLVPCSVGVESGDAVGVCSYDIPADGGGVYRNVSVPVFFGLKNMYGNLWNIVGGLMVDVGDQKSPVYVAPSLYDDYDKYSVEGMIFAAEHWRGEGFIKKLSMNKLCCIPTEIGATPSTYYADQNYTTFAVSQGLRYRLSGGSAQYHVNAGAFISNLNHAVYSAHGSVSAPLCYFEEDPIMR